MITIDKKPLKSDFVVKERGYCMIYFEEINLLRTNRKRINLEMENWNTFLFLRFRFRRFWYQDKMERKPAKRSKCSSQSCRWNNPVYSNGWFVCIEIFVYVYIILGVGNYQLMKWVQYSDIAIFAIERHKLGNPCGWITAMIHITYPSNEQIYNTKPFL